MRKHPVTPSPIAIVPRLPYWLALLLALCLSPPSLAAPEPVVIGLDADLSAGSARAGEAIRRGALIAIDEINERGGVLGGRPLELRAKDHRGVPVRSTDNLKAFAALPNLAAVLGGLHSPAIIQNHALIHDRQLIMLVPWSAATAVIDAAPQPSYVFRISVRDALAGPYLTEQALRRGYQRLGLLLEQTGWGRGNEASIKQALAERGLEPPAVEWINWGETDLLPAILSLEEAGAEALILVANAPEGAAAIQAMAKRPNARRLPILSHWGITGGRFVELAGPSLHQVELRVLQTYSFIDTSRPATAEVLSRYRERFQEARPAAIPGPVGTAQAYDLVHLLALAIDQAGRLDRPAIRSALERIEAYSGLIRDYRPPFTTEDHEGLSVSDYRLMRYGPDGTLQPIADGEG